MERVIKCKTLLGSNNLDFSIACLQSFLNKSQDKIHLEIFEDGTLTKDDEVKLLNSLKTCEIISKEARDKKINEKLAAFPNCYKYRNFTIYAHKIFDVMLYDENDLLFIDSDILFLKEFKLPEFLDTPAFIEDKQHAYSFSPVEFSNINIPIFPHVNTGLFYFPNSLFSLKFLEQLLGDNIISKGLGRISWLEQTLWAFLAAQTSSVNYFDKNQIIMAREKLAVDKDTIAIHLVSSFRYHFEQLNSSFLNDLAGEYNKVKLKKISKYLNKFEFASDRLKKAVFRRIGVQQ